MTVFNQVENFLIKFCSLQTPLLLALSGGPDSLCLFYALLAFRERYGTPFHVAHIDHRWRQESQEEAKILQQLAFQYQIPFHLKELDPTLLKGNLEAACREERYAFFMQLCQQIPFQGVLTGHHQDDQAETVFKRLLEGAHWSRWSGLQSESWINGIRILRPFLEISKSEIQQTLSQSHIQAFEDPSNHHSQFLRARLRETVFPRLNQEFGKQVQKSLSIMGKEARELTDYFNARLMPLLEYSISGPWGIYLDLQTLLPESLLEIKYLLRLLCQQQGFFLSREIIEQAAQALQSNKANQYFEMGFHRIWIDRQRVFILASTQIEIENQSITLSPGIFAWGSWEVNISEHIYLPNQRITSWKEGWKGRLESYVPVGSYQLGFKSPLDTKGMRKYWSQAKVPAFLYHYFPLIWGEREFCQEFLTGKSFCAIAEKAPCWRIELNFL